MVPLRIIVARAARAMLTRHSPSTAIVPSRIAAVGRFALVALLALSPLRFPSSGAPGAQPSFLRGVTALHNFEYEDAVEAFREAQRMDPDFAMAYWGEAMTYHQTLWRNENILAGREALKRLVRDWADVLVENYRPGAFKALGLG